MLYYLFTALQQLLESTEEKAEFAEKELERKNAELKDLKEVVHDLRKTCAEFEARVVHSEAIAQVISQLV